MNYKIIRLTDRPELKAQAALWFHDKWDIPVEAYTESMEQCLLRKQAVPQWYIALEEKEKGIDTLYLVTDHTSFYERYGWEFLFMVQGDGETELTRMYVHRV